MNLPVKQRLKSSRRTTSFTCGATWAWTLLALLGFGTLSPAETVRLYFDAGTPPIAFAAGDIKTVLEKQSHTVQTHDLSALTNDDSGSKIVLALADDTCALSNLAVQGGAPISGLGPQAYALRTTTNAHLNYWAFGGDAVGAMYGGLQIAENLSFHGLTASFNSQESPFLLNRGMKLNLPLDKRIPTYVGGWSSHSAQEAIPHVWDMTFWKTLIDQQARNRYNVLSIWVHHPFPALVRVPDYPNACLPNIQRYDGSIINLNHDQRVAFWREVMRYAHSRGMRFYLFNWNIYVDYASTQYPALTRDQSNPTTIDYHYKSMQALLETYPELDGFGISGGDGMSGTSEEKTQWTWDALGKAVYDYLTNNPSRQFDLIRRNLGTTVTLCNNIFGPLKSVTNATLNMSQKYAMAHMYSTPTPGWAVAEINSCFTVGLQTWLTLRNDDYFYLNWGDPQFVRDFMNGIPRRDTTVVGMYVGSDGYNPTRTYFCKNAALNGQLEVERRWFMETLWGRLSYNPAMEDEVLTSLLAAHYGLSPSASSNLLGAWMLASRSLPKVTELVMKNWSLDFHWYPEGCWSDPARCTGFRTISDAPGATGGFAGQDVASGSSLCNIANSAAGTCGGKKSSYQLADEMQTDASHALALISTVASGGNLDLDAAIKNVRQMACLSRYYAHKIRGATYGKAGNIAAARNEMGQAYCSWISYSQLMDEMYYGDSFRSFQVLPNWKFVDAAVLKEYTDLGGVGYPNCDDLFTLTTSGTNGSITLNPSGGVYRAGTVVTVTASPDFGYAFGYWTGDLTGSVSPTTLTMDTNKSVTAHFVVSSADVAPWLETFTLSDGVNSHGAPTSWRATRASGQFQVGGNRFMINGASGEGVLETAPIHIPGGSVNASVEVQGAGGLDSGDYVRFYKIVDGGAKVLIGQQIGNVTGTNTMLGPNIVGTTLKLRIEASVSASDEFYFIDNLKVEYEAPQPAFTLTTSATHGAISLNPPGGLYTTGTVVTVTAIPNSGYAFANWSGDLAGSTNPATLLMNGNKNVVANFNPVVTPGNREVLFVVGDAATLGPSDLAIRNRLQGSGYTVQVVSDEVATATHATGKGLVLTSSTVGSGTLNMKFQDVAVPVINWETFVQDDYGFATTMGNVGSQTALNITQPGHPLAAGLPAGVRTVATVESDFSWGEPGGSPIVIARLSDGSHPCLYAYEGGAAMSTGLAPARRVHLFLQNETFAVLNADGVRLFDAALSWATGQAAPIRFEPPVLQEGQVRLEWGGGGTLQTATNLTGLWNEVSGATSPYLSPMTNTAQFFRLKQ